MCEHQDAPAQRDLGLNDVRGNYGFAGAGRRDQDHAPAPLGDFMSKRGDNVGLIGAKLHHAPLEKAAAMIF